MVIVLSGREGDWKPHLLSVEMDLGSRLGRRASSRCWCVLIYNWQNPMRNAPRGDRERFGNPRGESHRKQAGRRSFWPVDLPCKAEKCDWLSQQERMKASGDSSVPADPSDLDESDERCG